MHNNGKIFNRFTSKQVFPTYVYNLMRDGCGCFVVFTDNWQLLNEQEYDEWTTTNGLSNDTPRIIYKPIGYGSYNVHFEGCILDLTIPLQLLKFNYDEFMENVINDLALNKEEK